MRRLFAIALLAFTAQAQLPKILRTTADLQQAENALYANPRNDKLAGDILEYYLGRWTDPKLEAGRLHFILWIISNRPDIDLNAAVHDPRALLVSTTDQAAYAQVRAAWFRQAALQPGNARVLFNAARSVRFTDRETAANWLKTAANYDSESAEYSNTLARFYAETLTGISAISPFEEPMRLDPEIAKSLFARQIKEEAMQDSILGAHVGWQVHLIAMQLRAAGITETDYDTVAEELLLNAANLDYPKPSKVPLLAQFYSDQSLKLTHKILPKFPEIEANPKTQAQLVVDFPKTITSEELTKSVKVPVTVLIGVDGHVWKAESADGSTDTTTRIATSSMLGWTFKPLRVSGEPVQVTTTFDVTIDPPKPTKK
jgi:hypothetical protein